jgi:hypothetical protein
MKTRLLCVKISILLLMAQSARADLTNGLVAYYPFSGNANDASGNGNDGAANGVTLTTDPFGNTNSAYAFPGIGGDKVTISSASLLLQPPFSCVAWMNSAGGGSGSPRIFTTGGWELAIGTGSVFGFNFNDNTTSGVYNCPSVSSYTSGTWHQVVAVRDTNAMYLYIDGQLQNSTPVSDPIVFPGGFGSSYLVAIGGSAGIGYGSDSFNGTIDEVRVYNRALSSLDVTNLFNLTPLPPSITTQPASQTVLAGATVTFSPVVTGTSPFIYQWRFNGTNLAAATNSSLSLTNVQPGQSGNYSLAVTNAAGVAISSNAVLTVNFPPAAIRAISTNAPACNVIAVPIQIVANGNEYAISFSLGFTQGSLTCLGTLPGSGLSGASLYVNTNQPGRLGVDVVMPWPTTFPAGTQEVARVMFGIVNVTNSTSTTVSFGDQPVLRQLSDPLGNSLPATYSSATIFVAAATALEGDASPRPNGNRAASLTDWILLGRYAARLDYPANANEFQRADCAPYATLGDGRITVADWVEAGRFANTLDPLTPAGGPTNEIAGPGAGPSASRVVTLAGTSLAQGQTGTLGVTLSAQGNENALGFGLNYNPAALAFVGASPGSDAGSVTLIVNTNGIGSGQIGLVLALPTGMAFPAGTREIVRMTMRALASSAGNYAISFTDQPVIRETSDPSANALPTSYTDATVVTHPVQPTLQITLLDTNVNLSWPTWAADFNLQSVSSLTVSNNWTNVPALTQTNGSTVYVTLPVTGTAQIFRLSHP